MPDSMPKASFQRKIRFIGGQPQPDGEVTSHAGAEFDRHRLWVLGALV